MSRTNDGGEPLISLLLPGTADPALDELSFSTFTDGEVSVPVSPIDQLLVAFSRRVVRDVPLGGVGIVQLPRARHRIALTLAICVHLLRLRDHLFAGPVVLAALDVDLTAQLRQLSIRNYGRISLGRDNPLSAQRLTRAGDLASLLGGPAAPADGSLVYLNTRVGAPRLRSSAPVVIIDATSITNPDGRARALDWVAEHSAVGTIIVGDIGDDSLVQTVTDAGHVPLVLPITEDEVTALVYDLNRQKPTPSGLSSMWLLWQNGVPPLVLHRAGDDDLNAAVAGAFACLATRPDGPMPVELDYATKLLNSGTRLAATVSDYRTACALANRPGEGPAPLRRRLSQLTFDGPGPWRPWGVARWGQLKVAVETLWRHLDEGNPKLVRLWEALDHAKRSGVDRILIRCHSKAAAAASKASLTGAARTDAQVALWERVSDRVEVTTFATRYPPGYAEVQILTGNPPPWHFSLLVSAEAANTWVLAYDAERSALRRQVPRWQHSIDGWRRATFRALGAQEPDAVDGPLVAGTDGATNGDPPELRLPGLSILEVLDRASTAVDAPTVVTTPGGWHAAGTTRSCVPVELGDGRTWWVPDEEDSTGHLATPVLVVTAAGEKFLPLRDVGVGDVVIVAAGDGTDSVHARLVAATHTNDDVASLDAILEQFRSAARTVLRTKPTQRAAIEAVRVAGAQAAGQLTFWASGRTIAPQEPGDIAAVFRAAGQPVPDLRLLNSVAGTLRNLHRALGRFVTALRSGRADDAVEGLRRLIGDSAEELLDEFVAATVASVGQPTPVPANLAGRLR